MPHTQGFQCRKRIEKGEKRSILLIEGEIEKTTGRKAKQTKKVTVKRGRHNVELSMSKGGA